MDQVPQTQGTCILAPEVVFSFPYYGGLALCSMCLNGGGPSVFFAFVFFPRLKYGL